MEHHGNDSSVKEQQQQRQQLRVCPVLSLLRLQEMFGMSNQTLPSSFSSSVIYRNPSSSTILSIYRSCIRRSTLSPIDVEGRLSANDYICSRPLLCADQLISEGTEHQFSSIVAVATITAAYVLRPQSQLNRYVRSRSFSSSYPSTPSPSPSPSPIIYHHHVSLSLAILLHLPKT